MSNTPSHLKPKRGSDPVREDWKQMRIAYWPSGRPGVKDEKGRGRVYERQDSEEQMIARAAELRDRFARRRGAGPATGVTLAEAVREWIAWLEKQHAPPGTISQYRSAFNAHVPRTVMLTPARDLDLTDWEAIFDPTKLKPGTIRGVRTALGSFIKWATTRGYFGDGLPWGGADHRNAIYEECLTGVRNRAANRKAGLVVVKKLNRLELAERAREEHEAIRQGISLAVCPSPDEVERLAAALESRWEGYGAAFIRTIYATGWRFGEALGAVADDVGEKIRVERQLNQYRPWPATMPTKHRIVRDTICWEWLRPELDAVVERASAEEEHAPPMVKVRGVWVPTGGWLFPLGPTIKARSNLYHNVEHLLTQVIREIGWHWRGVHWLRHAFASTLLAPAPHGYGRSVSVVQELLGHASPDTTRRYYEHQVEGEHAAVLAATAARPGQLGATGAGELLRTPSAPTETGTGLSDPP